jgi:hypothetical protein
MMNTKSIIIHVALMIMWFVVSVVTGMAFLIKNGGLQ